jgi:DNA-binding MarR family transcriptional regulator
MSQFFNFHEIKNDFNRGYRAPATSQNNSTTNNVINMPVLSIESATELLRKNGLIAKKVRVDIIQLLSVFSAPIPQKELERLLEYDRVTVYRIIKAFESKKLVCRSKDSKGKNLLALILN